MNLSDILFILAVAIILVVCLVIKKKNNKNDKKEQPTKCRGCANYSFCKRGKEGEKGNL